MSFHPKHLIRYGLAVFLAAAAVGCSSDGTGTDDGEIAIALNPTSASVVQGGNTAVTATLTRSGGFTGTVVFAVTGNPAGVTAALSNEVTTGLVTTATVTVTVGSAVAAGTYPLTVTGTGSGVDPATATFTLTVTAAPAAAYTMTVPAAVSIAAGASTPTVNVALARTNFTGNVTLSVEGLPAGVTAAFVPNPATANASVLTLTVGAGVAAQVYNLTVRGVAAGLTDRTAPLALTVTAAPAPAYTMTVPAAVTIAAGASTPTVNVALARTNFAGNVTLSVEGLPAGVTAAFVPNPATADASVLTLTVGAAVAAQVYNLTVRGVAAGLTDRTAPLALTVTAVVTGNFTLTTTPATSASVAQGASTNVTVNVVRTGGFAGTVNLTATGLPAGLTAVFTPAGATGATSTLALTATAGLAVGAYPIVIRGNFAGLAEQTVNLTVNVTASGGGSGNVTVSFAACTAANKAAWFAFQDGTGGAWTRVTGVNDVYQFNITQGKGGFAYVLVGAGTNATINVLYFTQAELIAGQFGLCATTTTAKTVNATVANLPANAQGRVSFGAGFGSTLVNGVVQITNVLDGAHDLVAYAGGFLGPAATDRGFISRALNPANGGSLGTVDFTGAGSFVVASAPITVVGGLAGETYSQGMFYQTGATCDAAVLYSIGTFAASPFTAYGIPAANQAATDFHRLSVTAINAGLTDFRLVSESFKTLAARNLTLPAALGAVTVTDAGGPYKRIMVVTTLPAELNSSVVVTYVDNTVVGKAGTIIASAGWLGGLAVSLTLPDFSALAGWSNAWAPATGDNLSWTVSGSTANLVSLCQEGGRVASSTKTGTF